jgi:predicted hydrocarbon binding protein
MNDQEQGIELVRLPAAAIGAIRSALIAERGAREAAVLLRRMGLESGPAFYELFRDWLASAQDVAVEPEELGADEFWDRLSDFFEHLGWGAIRFEQLHDAVISLSMSNWAELRGDGSSPGAHFTAGLLAELLRRVAEGDIAALEVEADDDQPGSCRLLFGAPDAVESVFLRIREGAGVADAVGRLG